MDSSVLSHATFTLINERLSMTHSSKCALFLATFRRNQLWSLPDSVVYYMAKNPSTSKCYEMLIKSCKYFFIINSLLIVSKLSVDYICDEWRIYLDDKRVNLQNLSSKIWPTNKFIVKVFCKNADNQYFSSIILPRIYKSDIRTLHANLQNIAFDDLIFLASKCEEIDFHSVTVRNADGFAVSLERILEALPCVKVFQYYLQNTDPNIITSKTVKEITKITHFLNLNFLSLINVPESFNLNDFYSYIKNNQNTNISFYITVPISEEYRNYLQDIVNEIIQTKDHGYKVPHIRFPGIDQSFSEKLQKLYYHL